MTPKDNDERKLLLEKLEKIVRETIIHEEPYLSKGWSYNGLNALADFILAHTAKEVEAAREQAWLTGYEAGRAVASGELKGISWEQAKVREILEFVWNLSPHNKDRMAEAEQALYDAMLALVGKDEPRTGENAHIDIEREGRNNLRAEQRKALNALFEKKGK